MLNVNWEKNSPNNLWHSSWLKKISPTHTHPLISIPEFLIAYELLFFELVTHKMLNLNWEKIHPIILCHSSWLKKISPAHRHPVISIREYLIAYELLFFELESLIKC